MNLRGVELCRLQMVFVHDRLEVAREPWMALLGHVCASALQQKHMFGDKFFCIQPILSWHIICNA